MKGAVSTKSMARKDIEISLQQEIEIGVGCNKTGPNVQLSRFRSSREVVGRSTRIYREGASKVHKGVY